MHPELLEAGARGRQQRGGTGLPMSEAHERLVVIDDRPQHRLAALFERGAARSKYSTA